MAHTFINQEVDKIIIDESLIESISWENQFKDIVIKIDWCGQEDLKELINFNQINSSLHFEFVTEFDSAIRFKETTMGGMEITSFSCKEYESKWLIEFRFDFYPVGFIKFECNALKFIVEER